MSVNDKVRALRELNNWSQEEVAERMQISESSYSRLERGKSKLDLEKLEKLAAIFKIDVAELIASDGKGLILFNGENSCNHSSYYLGHQEELIWEVEKLKLQLQHEKELRIAKEEMLQQKNDEIQALRQILSIFQKV